MGQMKPDGRPALWLLIGLGAILLALFLSWFFTNFERRSREIDSGYSAAAQRNPYLAAERFLARLGVPVESLAGRDRLRDLPPPDDTLVVNSLGVLNAERQEALHLWVERGGRLIVEAVHLWDEDDSTEERRGYFLERYGVRLFEQAGRTNLFDVDDEVVAAVDIDDYQGELDVGFGVRYFLEDASGEASGHVVAEENVRLLQYEIGNGLLTVASDNRFLTNSHIGRHDHALFLALLADPPGNGKVWLLYDSGMPWLGALLWHRAPLVIISSLGLLIFFLWYQAGRLGPFVSGPAGDRRDLLAHLQASAGFLWRHGQGSRLTELSRGRIEQFWLRRHPTLRKLDQAGRVTWIAGRVGIAPTDVERVLYPKSVSEGDLVTDTVLLQRLWSSLSAPGAAVSSSRCEA